MFFGELLFEKAICDAIHFRYTTLVKVCLLELCDTLLRLNPSHLVSEFVALSSSEDLEGFKDEPESRYSLGSVELACVEYPVRCGTMPDTCTCRKI